jgi:hypothetical protein
MCQTRVDYKNYTLKIYDFYNDKTYAFNKTKCHNVKMR